MKRGISPLISVVLLISFTVVISVLVMSWIRQNIETQQERATEQAAKAQGCLLTEPYIVPASEKGICYDSDTQIRVIVDNQGDTDILTMTVRVLYNDGQADVIDKNITLGGLTPLNREIFTVDLAKGTKNDVSSVEVIPEIAQGVCRDSIDKFTVPKSGIISCA